MRRRSILLIVAPIVAATLAGCSSSGSSAAKDVTVTACTPSPTGGHPTATGRILNHSSKASLYAVHVKFTDSAGNKVGDGVAAVAKVDSGSTATWHATGSLDAKGPLKCTLSSVVRTVAP